MSPPPKEAPRSPLEHATEYNVNVRSLSRYNISHVSNPKPVFKVKERCLHNHNDAPFYHMTITNFHDLRYPARIVHTMSGRTLFVLRRKEYGSDTIFTWKGNKEEGEPYLRAERNMSLWLYSKKTQFTVKEHANDKLVAEAHPGSQERDSFVLRVEAGYSAPLMVFFGVSFYSLFTDLVAQGFTS